MAPALVYLAGIVCGAILLADEKEVGTFEFLDSLPCRRQSLWIGKAIFGVGLTYAQCVIFAGLATLLQCVPSNASPLGYFAALTFIGLLAFGWGIFGGALCRSTLGAVFVGAILSFAVGLVLAIPVAAIVGARMHGLKFSLIALAYLLSWLGISLFASAAIFTVIDRRRRARRRILQFDVAEQSVPRRGPRFGIAALVWLSMRQAVFVTIGAFAFGIILGGVMQLSPEASPFLIWPGVLFLSACWRASPPYRKNRRAAPLAFGRSVGCRWDACG